MYYRCSWFGLTLLDKPLATQYCTLRKDLRAEILKIAEASEAIFIYAHTGPEETPILAKNTAILSEGQHRAI
jgi:glycerol transport system ATP-binding protein